MRRKGFLAGVGAAAIAAGILAYGAYAPGQQAQQGRACPIGQRAPGRRLTRAERIYRVAKRAYIYAYPMVTMEMTKRVMTNVTAPQTSGRAPINQFGVTSELPTPQFKDVVRPGRDTVYAAAWLDLSNGPMVLSVPDTHGRYYIMQMLDAWTNVFAAPGKRTTGTGAARFAIVGPSWQGGVPEGMRVYKAPTNMVWLIGRVHFSGPADLPDAIRLSHEFELRPLAEVGRPYTPPVCKINPRINTEMPPRQQVARMDGVTFFRIFAATMMENPPHLTDGAMVASLHRLGIVPGERFDPSRLDAATRAAIDRAARDAHKRIAAHAGKLGVERNGWRIMRKNAGTYGANYLDRASVALARLGTNLPQDAVYASANIDRNCAPLTGARSYVLHLRNGALPPVNAFWSVTLYGPRGFLVTNPIDRYSLGSNSDLTRNADGSVDIYIQRQPPAQGKRSNWLPAPQGKFTLMMRLYWPKPAVLTGRWNPPPLRPVSPARTPVARGSR